VGVKNMHPLIIVGTGLAAYSLAREFRRLDQNTPLLLISADDGCAYAKPMLSNAFAQGKTPAQLATAEVAAMRQNLAADILTHTQVTAIDTEAKQVHANGQVYSYHALVLAVGAQPVRPPMQGEAAAVLSVNNLEDYRKFRAHLQAVKKLAIIGPGLIGCEFANDIATQGIEVSVIGPDAWPLSGLLPEAVGQALGEGLTRLGIGWHLGVTVPATHKNGAGYQLELSDGQRIDADLVLSAVGLRADTRLAQAAGLATARAIVCDEYLRTSAADVYALGDCAEVNGQHLPYVAPLMAGAKALAKTLSGTPTPVRYPIMPVVIKTPAYPVVAVPPPREAPGSWQIETTDSGVSALFHSPTGELSGFALSGAAVADKQKLVKAMETAQT
jgi:rubredoxin---NAD+ reductase